MTFNVTSNDPEVRNGENSHGVFVGEVAGARPKNYSGSEISAREAIA